MTKELILVSQDETKLKGDTMKLITVEDLSKKLSVPIGTLYQWTSRKKIPYIKMHGNLRFNEEEIDKWLENMKVKELVY